MDIVVLNYNDSEHAIDYVSKIIDFDSVEHIVIVDNSSTDDSYFNISSIFSSQIKVDILETGKNGGYGFGNNYGIKHLINKYGSKYIAITNPDVVYSEDVLIECEKFLVENQDYCVVAPRMKDINGNFEGCSWEVPSWIALAAEYTQILSRIVPVEKEHLDRINGETKQVDCVAGSMLCVNARTFDECGMYDPNMFLYYEETLLGIKLKRENYKTAVILTKSFIHAHSVSIDKAYKSKFGKQILMYRSRKYLIRRYYELSDFKKMCAELLMGVSVVELYLKDKIKMLLSKNR